MHVGIDICSVARLEKALVRSPQLLREVFSAEEIAYCTAQRRPLLHLAARWAAKEAVVKSCGADLLACDLSRLWVDKPGSSGQPRLRVQCEVLRARLEAVCSPLPAALNLSLSHDDDYAVACVVLP